MKRPILVRTMVFSGVLVLHWVGQFVAWSLAERGGPLRLLWVILATPILHLRLADQYFWALATANSVLWATLVTYFAGRLLPISR